MNEQMVTFLDQLGRVIVGTKVELKEQTLRVKNPVIVHTQPTQTGGMSIQFFPIFFREFQADKDEATVWNYNIGNITICDDIVLDIRLMAQYNQIFAPVKNSMPMGTPNSQVGQATNSTPQVIKLFDE